MGYRKKAPWKNEPRIIIIERQKINDNNMQSKTELILVGGGGEWPFYLRRHFYKNQILLKYWLLWPRKIGRLVNMTNEDDRK